MQRDVDRADFLTTTGLTWATELTTVTLTVWSFVVTVAWPLAGVKVGGLNVQPVGLAGRLGSVTVHTVPVGSPVIVSDAPASSLTVPFLTLSLHHPHRCS